MNSKPSRKPGLFGLSFDRSRRQFTRDALALFILASCKPRGSELNETKSPPNPDLGRGKHVLVLGGGIAGLCAAYNLRKNGFQTTIIEKTKRFGGRVWTNRGYFCDDQYCEFGATRIPDIHNHTLDYIKELGLSAVPASFGDDDNRLYDLNGKIFKKKDPATDIKALLNKEGEHLETLLAHLELANFSGVIDETKLLTKLSNLGLDQMNFADWLSSDKGLAALTNGKKYSKEEVDLIASSNGSEVRMFSALMWMAQEVVERKWDATFRTKGGNDQIGTALYLKLNEKADASGRALPASRTESFTEVQTVHVSAATGKVSVDCVQRGSKISFDGDFVVCALPLDALHRVQWSHGLSADKEEASQSVRMQYVTRINAQFKKRFWENDEGLKGLKILHSNRDIERCWDMTVSDDQKEAAANSSTFVNSNWSNPNDNSSIGNGQCNAETSAKSEKGILTCYIQNDHAKEVGLLSPKARQEKLLSELRTTFPRSNVESLFIKGNSFVWHQQSWVGGGWAAYGPGQLHLYLATREPEAEHRLIFAGDHTTVECGWIQGALESGERASEEVIAAVKRSA